MSSAALSSLLWAGKQTAAVLYLLVRGAASALASIGRHRSSLTPRHRTHRSHRRLLVRLGLIATVLMSMLTFKVETIAGFHDSRAMFVALVIAQLMVIVTTATIWPRWLNSPAGLRWQLERELENPRRRGFRTPRASVKVVRLP